MGNESVILDQDGVLLDQDGRVVHETGPAAEKGPDAQSTKLSVQQLRSQFNTLLDTADGETKSLSNMIRVVDLGDTKQSIVDALQQIDTLSRTKNEGFGTRFLRNLGLGGVVDRAKDTAAAAAVEGKTIAQVSQELLGSMIAKRDRVAEIVDELCNLKDSMVQSYVGMKAIVDGIDENCDQYTEAEQFHLQNLKQELLETMSYHQDNITSAAGTINAAGASCKKISQMIPKLRSQVNDSMMIRGALNELQELTTLCDTIDEACQELRSENRTVMEGALLGVLNSAVVSDKALALIDKNARDQQQLQLKVHSAMDNIAQRREVAVTRMQKTMENNNTALLTFAENAQADHLDRV